MITILADHDLHRNAGTDIDKIVLSDVQNYEVGMKSSFIAVVMGNRFTVLKDRYESALPCGKKRQSLHIRFLRKMMEKHLVRHSLRSYHPYADVMMGIPKVNRVG